MNETNKPNGESQWPQSEGVDQQRTQAAQLIERQRATILSRIHRLLGDDARRMTDTDDILSTALRRVDQVIEKGALEAQNEKQFFAFVHGVIERTVLEKTRKSRGFSARERIAQEIKGKIAPPVIEQRVVTSDELNQIGGMITDPVDREIILLRGRDLSFNAISEVMQMSPTAVRKRWSRIRASVRAYIVEGSSDDDSK